MLTRTTHLHDEQYGLGPKHQPQRVGARRGGAARVGATVIEKGTNNGAATGGAWDAVQMGSNGRFLFAKL